MSKIKAENIISKLIKNKITVSCAESCTGGLVSAAFTDVSGVSEIFAEGVVTYANEAKVRLGVPKRVIDSHGAVSAETACCMAKAVRMRAGTDIGISTTGIAGPTGGTDKKPVGLVYIGISTKKATIAIKNNFTGAREQVRKKTVEKIFNVLERMI